MGDSANSRRGNELFLLLRIASALPSRALNGCNSMTDYRLPNNSCDLSGQVALVTGASSGLGWRFARVLASSGARVALTKRRTLGLRIEPVPIG